ncbi:CaiB/BaiF CoA-transferase family protein [Nibribacter koreensis]|uniref:CaiB/BaiF CoA-transferase family protein n=2 Tax=Nibribacter koreensis TaxID=1084519 RepID=A0ABP8FF72_9BACT
MMVIELASVLAGPSVGQFFAELGASVIKVENLKTQGDVTRRWRLATESSAQDVSAYFASANWGKQSIALDLSQPEGREVAYKLLDKADMVITSFKPGDAEKLQLDYKTLTTRNPKLLYGAITGYGSQEPRAGYDAVLQAEAGFMYLNGKPGGPPVKMPVALIDLLAAHQLKEGLLTALLKRERSGKGSYVEVSLLRAAIASLANQATNYLVAGVTPQRMGSEHPNIVPYGTVFQTADQKDLVLAIGDDRQFAHLCAVLGIPNKVQDPAFATNKARVQHRQEVNAFLKAEIKKQNREELLASLIARQVPAGAIHTIPEALAIPAAQAQLVQDAGSGLKGLRQVAFSSENQQESQLMPPPAFGQHTHQVLEAMAGFTAAQVQKLKDQGIAQ